MGVQLALALAASAPALAADNTCSVRKAGPAPTVVELYTSEGCSSCPPAEAWLNGLKGRTDVLALAFHVNYWDKLGWPDRFASAEATERQYRLAGLDGQRGVYTPQVRVAGRDWRRWPDLPSAATALTLAAAPTLQLARDGDAVVVRVDASTRSGALAGYWAVLEDDHETRVRAGENAGATFNAVATQMA